MSRGPFLALASFLVVGALLALAAPGARAEDEEGLDEVSAQVKAQMEKIVELMRKNEKALLDLSTGQHARPEGVDVDVTPPESPAGSPPSGGGSEATGPEGGGGGRREAGAAGEAARKSLDEMIRSQRSTGSRIPGELEELVRMVPQ